MTGRADHAERLRRLADAVRRSELAHRDVLTSRNNEMIDALEAGLSFGAIAKSTGLTRGYVQDVVSNHTRKPDADPVAADPVQEEAS